MRIAAGLLALTLLGCQSSTAPTATTLTTPSPQTARVNATEVVPAPPRRPLARLNPRRQRLQVGEAPLKPRPLPQKERQPEPKSVVQVFIPPQRPRVNAPSYYAPPRQTQSLHASQPAVPTRGWPPPAATSLSQAERSRMQAEAFVAQEQERIRQNNAMLMSRPQPGGGMTPEMQRLAYPQVQGGSSEAHQAAERRYLEARADFLNTKYSPNGPLRYTPESVRGMVGTGMPLPPPIMNQPALFNPVLQKAQQTEVLRQQMVATP